MKIALVAGLALMVLAIGVALARSPMSVARINRTSSSEEKSIASTRGSADYCQAREVLPLQTSAIRISLDASIGPRVRLALSSGGHPIAGGEQGSGWTGAVVTVPVKPLSRTVYGVTVCASFRARNESLTLYGEPIPGMVATYDGARRLPGSMRLEYLRPGARSWASLIPSIVHHMGLGRAFEGSGIVLFAFALLAAVAILAATLVVKELS